MAGRRGAACGGRMAGRRGAEVCGGRMARAGGEWRDAARDAADPPFRPGACASTRRAATGGGRSAAAGGPARPGAARRGQRGPDRPSARPQAPRPSPRCSPRGPPLSSRHAPLPHDRLDRHRPRQVPGHAGPDRSARSGRTASPATGGSRCWTRRPADGQREARRAADRHPADGLRGRRPPRARLPGRHARRGGRGAHGRGSGIFYGLERAVHHLAGPFDEALSGFAGTALRLVEMADPGTGVDRADLGARSRSRTPRRCGSWRRPAGATEPLDQRRFRMTLGIDGVRPYAEDAWLGGRARGHGRGAAGRQRRALRDHDPRPGQGGARLRHAGLPGRPRGELETTEPLPSGSGRR